MLALSMCGQTTNPNRPANSAAGVPSAASCFGQRQPSSTNSSAASKWGPQSSTLSAAAGPHTSSTWGLKAEQAGSTQEPPNEVIPKAANGSASHAEGGRRSNLVAHRSSLGSATGSTFPGLRHSPMLSAPAPAPAEAASEANIFHSPFQSLVTPRHASLSPRHSGNRSARLLAHPDATSSQERTAGCLGLALNRQD